MATSVRIHGARKRRTKAEVEAFEAAILAVFDEYKPRSCRNIFYAMTNPRIGDVAVPKTERGYKHVQRRLVQMRLDGRLPYGYIVDASRLGYHETTFADSEEYIRSMGGLYRQDLWEDTNYHVEVWAESRSIASVIRADCRELAVSLYPSGGFASHSFVFEAAQDILRIASARPVAEAVILYAGDFDPAGVIIDRDIERKMRHHLGDEVPLSFHRLAVNEEQVTLYDLPTKPRKETDRRVLTMRETVEAEAMDPRDLRRIVRTAVESYLPPGALAKAKIIEGEERSFLKTFDMSRYRDKPGPEAAP